MIQCVEEVVATAVAGYNCDITGRVTAVRKHSNVLFLDVEDHTGKVQIVVEKTRNDIFAQASHITPGSYITVSGTYGSEGLLQPEILAASLTVESLATLAMSPLPWEINGLHHRHGKQIFDFPGYYLANPQRASVLRIKTNFVLALHRYFQDNKFTLVEPPILTDKVLYTPESAVRAQLHGEEVFLSQCATFELEPLAMVFKKVYTISPAFRNEPAGSKRHLAEYTHVKAEVLFADLDSLIHLASEALYQALENCLSKSELELSMIKTDINLDKMHPKNHVRITYDEAFKIAQAAGSSTEYSHGLTDFDKQSVTRHLDEVYVWVMFPPFDSEGFPYRRKSDAPHLSMVADLIAPNGAGELVGVAEKIANAEELIENLILKGKGREIRQYWDYILLRKQGMPPHGGLGAAPERILYGLLGLNHIRLTKPWPRYPDRHINSQPEKELNPWRDEDLDRLIKKYNIT
ncbi:hypothetical protein HYV81_02180 [Candidatus Woesearchaeota archaeon]|nr:hypothetical protein [Candidatus Woesearchaeota archaeon]